MPEIGSSLREARMRARIDITEAEADTKIRGKYLRALENEEWDLLPGPTFVKSFLRTYADYLGLDGRMLVEQFKLRYERAELQPIAPPGSSRDRQRRAQRGERRPSGGSGIGGRALLIGGLVAALLVGLFFLGRGGGDGGNGSSTPAATTTTTRSTSTARTTTTKAVPAAPKVARLQIVPTGQVYVCLRAADGRTLVNGVILQPGTAARTYRSKRLRLTLGNGDARLVVNGKRREVPSVSRGISYVISPTGADRIPLSEGPSC